jgi:hypothetical protein
MFSSLGFYYIMTNGERNSIDGRWSSFGLTINKLLWVISNTLEITLEKDKDVTKKKIEIEKIKIPPRRAVDIVNDSSLA